MKDVMDFFDPYLETGFGRICIECIRNNKGVRTATVTNKKVVAPGSKIICSSCGSKMVLRNGAYGKFYGCSRYPKCKNTKKY